MRQLEVYVNDMKAGLLTEINPGKGYTFVYTEAYAASDMPPRIADPAKEEGGIRVRVFVSVLHELTTRRSKQIGDLQGTAY